MTFHGYQRVDSDPNFSDNQRTALLNENDDFGKDRNFVVDWGRTLRGCLASTCHAGIDDESSFDEIERQELRDHLGEIPGDISSTSTTLKALPDCFAKSKEALFGPSVTRGGYADAYESSQLLDSCHDKVHDDTDQSDDSKEEEEEEEEQGGAKKVGLITLQYF
ncbi:hypothetical protein COOONC_15781 [Cooperia oncophora]